MSSYILVGLIGFCAMIIVLAFFSEDIVEGQKVIKDSLLEKRKTSLYKLSLAGQENKELIKDVNKGYFRKRREASETLIFKADIRITYYEFLIISFLFGVIGWMIGDFLNNFIISVILCIVLFVLPKNYLKFISSSLKKQINEQLEPTLSQIIGLLPAKKTMINACEACVGSMQEPLKTYFTEFINNINNANRSFEEAINELARKIDSKPFYDFSRLAVVHYRQGGETMFAFNSIPETMRDIKMIQSAQEAELDSLKLMGYLFTFISPLAYLYYYFTDKDTFDILINTGPGKVITAIVFIIMLITFKLVLKVSEPVEL